MILAIIRHLPFVEHTSIGKHAPNTDFSADGLFGNALGILSPHLSYSFIKCTLILAFIFEYSSTSTL